MPAHRLRTIVVAIALGGWWSASRIASWRLLLRGEGFIPWPSARFAVEVSESGEGVGLGAVGGSPE